MANHFPLKLLDAELIAPSVRHLRFARADQAALPYVAGQFVQVHFEHNGAPSKRSYSLANPPGAEDYEIAVSYVEGGAATQIFQALEPGEVIQASGPYGRFCLMPADQNRRYVLVGTGTGITPYRAMLPSLAAAMTERNVRVVIVQGARSRADLLYADDFQAFADAHPNCDYRPCLSRDATCDLPLAQLGYVQDALPSLSIDAAQDISYLCGNPNMVDAAFAWLKEQGLPITAIRREKYISSR